MNTIITLVIGSAILGVIGMAIGDLGGKKNGPMGFLLGALLGPLGCIIAALLPPAADSDKAKVEAAEKHRIARLETELAAIKSKEAIPGKSSGKTALPVANDGEIPVYKLD